MTLFPFLAVLICTMGALILVLLSMTGKLRTQAMHAQQQAEQVAKTPIPRRRSVALPPIVIERQLDPEVEAERERRLHAWRQEVLDREAERERVRQVAADRRAELASAEATVTTIMADVAKLDEQIARSRLQAEQAAIDNQALVSRQASFESHVLQTRRNLEELKQRQASAPSRFSLVPFEGTSGTVRRPIYIECTGEGLKFIPEGQVLRISDLEGFTEGFNPVLAGAQSLVEYWMRKHIEEPEQNPKPYVLLLVRPSGAMSYYVARMMLTKLKLPFGYELVEEDFALTEPEADPVARALLETMVSRTLSAQPALMAAAGRRPVASGSARRLPGAFPGDRDSAGPSVLDSVRESMPRGDDRGDFGESSTGVDDDSALAGNVPPAESGTRRPGTRQAGDPLDGPLGDTPRAGSARGQPGDLPHRNGKPGGSQPATLGGLRDEGESEDQSATEAVPRIDEPWPYQSGQAGEESAPRGAPGEPRKLPILDDAPETLEGTGEASAGSQRSDAPRGLPRSQTPLRHAGPPGSHQDANEPPADSDPLLSREASPTRRSLLSRGQAGRSSDSDQHRKLRWTNNTGQTIGLEQDVAVHVYMDRIVIGENLPALGIALGESRQTLANKVGDRIEQVVADWGEPPRRFHWIPRVRFIVHPGGNQHYERLRDPIRQWGLSSTVEFSLDGVEPLQPPKPARQRTSLPARR